MIIKEEKKKLKDEENKIKNDKGKGKLEKEPHDYVPKVPFPHALKSKANKKPLVQQEELIELFKQVKINIPLLDTIMHVPTYVNFLKKFYTTKREPKEVTQRIRLSEDVNAVVMNHLPKN